VLSRRVLAAAAAGLLALVSGCGAARRDHAASPEIGVLLPPGERPFWEPIARAFEAERPGVRVALIEGPQSTDLRENLYTAALLARDPTFDLVYLDVTWTPKFAAAGWLRPLDDAFGPEERAEFLPAALAAGRHHGRLYRVPVRTDLGLTFARSDWLEEAGLPAPESFDGLERAARVLQHPPERWGWVWQGRQYEGLVCTFLEVLAGHGGFWIDPETGGVGLDRPEAVAAANALRRACGPGGISPAGVTTYQEEESRRLFQDGRAVFLRNWAYAYRLAQREDSPLRGAAVPPALSAGGASASPATPRTRTSRSRSSGTRRGSRASARCAPRRATPPRGSRRTPTPRCWPRTRCCPRSGTSTRTP
jgi:multiple sugar transport system substrate-binding protein